MPTSTLASGVLAGGATAARVGRSGSGALCAEHAISTDRNAIETKGTRLLPIPHLLLFATAVYAAVRRLATVSVTPDQYAAQNFDTTPSLTATTINDGTTTQLTLHVPAGTPSGGSATVRVHSALSDVVDGMSGFSADWSLQIIAQ